MSEQEESEAGEVKAQAKRVKPMPWLRPIVGLFSIITGVMYFVAAIVGFFLDILIRHNAGLDGEMKEKKVEESIASGKALEDATQSVDKMIENAVELSSYFGMTYVIMIAAIAGVSVMIGFAGVGLILKRSWSISMGRMGCITMMVLILVVIVYHKEGFTTLNQMTQEMDGKEVTSTGWMTIIRYIFLCCMCPISLLIGYGVVVKQYLAAKAALAGSE